MLIVAGGAQREFGQMQPAEIERARGIEPRHDAGRNAGAEVGADLRASGGQLAGAVEQVLVGERHAMQRRQAGPGHPDLVGGCGGFERAGAVETNHGV